jgi:putative ABC transport system permease protein
VSKTLEELRNAHRRLASAPTFTLCAVLCLALGLGATTATWSAVRRALIQPLPFDDPDRLVAVHRITPSSGPLGEKSQSPANYADMARQSHQLQSFAAVTRSSAVVNVGTSAMRGTAFNVTGNFFETLRAHARLGRLITPGDDELGAPRVVVVSDDFWRHALGGDPGYVGRSIPVDGSPAIVIGVLPADFRVPLGSRTLRADLWRPIRLTAQQASVRDNYPLETVGRLARGATVASAGSELAAIYAGLGRIHPELRGASVRVAPLQAENIGPLRTPLLLVLGAVAMVLAVALTNVAALLLASGVQRRREMAVRIALGATAWHTTRAALAESAVLVAWSLALGTGIALAAVRTIGALAANELPQLAGLSIDGSVLAFGITTAIVCAAVCAVAPAWRAARVDPQDALRGGRGGGALREHHRALRALVVAEMALSVVLLVGAGLSLRAFSALLSSDPGFDPRPILALNVNVVPTRYADENIVRSFVEPTLAAARNVAGVEAAGVISNVPFVAWGNNAPARYRWTSETDESRLPVAEVRRVSPGFFDVTRQRLIAGRLLQASDDERAAPVFVVNQALVDRDFQGRRAVGSELYSYGAGKFGTIVGVVSNVDNYGPFAKPVPEIDVTLQQGGIGTGISFMVRTRDANPMRVLAGIRAAVASVDPEAAVSDAMPMTDVIAHSLGAPHFYAEVLGGFAAAGVVLAIAGLYGVLSYGVSQRTREIGVRSALGGTPARIIGLIAGEGITMAAIGLALGAGAGLVVTRAMRSMLYGVSPLDAAAWMVAIVGLFAVGLVAAGIPAWRASRVPPVVAMRDD